MNKLITVCKRHRNEQAPGQETLSGSNKEPNESPASSDDNVAHRRDQDSQSERHRYPGKLEVGFIMVGLCLAVFCVALDTSILAVAVPVITNQFDSVDDVGWYASSYLLTSCATQLFYGKIYSYFNTTWVFTGALGIFEIGSLIAAAAPNSVALIIGRSIAGLGSGGILTGSMLIITHISPLSQRPALTGISNAMFGIASVLGPLLGGAFTDNVSWRWCFYINLPLGAVTAVLIVLLRRKRTNEMTRKMDDSWKARVKQMDVLGTSIFPPMTICLLLALQWGGSTYAWSSGRVIALLTLSGLLLIAFVVTQVIAKDKATIPISVLTQRSVAAAAIYRIFSGAAFFVVLYYLPIWFQVTKSSTALDAGLQTLPLLLSITVASILGGVTISKIGYYTPFIIAAAVFTSVGSGLLSTLEVSTENGKWIGYQILYGIGYGIGQQQSIIAVQAVLPPRDLPSGTALLIFAQILGGAVFVSVAQNVFQNRLISELDGIISDPRSLLEAGATSVDTMVPPESLEAVKSAYNTAIVSVFYVAAGAAAMAFFGAIFLEWKNVRKDGKLQGREEESA